MGRRAQGWRLYRDKRTGRYIVRFSRAGRRYTLTTGETDIDRAQTAATSIYEQAQRRGARRRVARAIELEEPLAEWIADVEAEVAPATASMYRTHAFAHLLPHFQNSLRLTGAEIADYVRRRLRQVQRGTVRLELTTLRRFLAWAVERGVLDAAPDVPAVPRAAAGTVHSSGTRKRVDLTAEQVERLLAELPGESKGIAVRAYFRVMWETGLRAGTMARLSVPEHYTRGSAELRISANIDKAHYARVIDLPDAARGALDYACSLRAGHGLIFGRHDLRDVLRDAAQRAGIDGWEHLSCHDLRHARLSLWGAQTTDVAALAYLAGHRQLGTTSRYVHPLREGARELILATDIGYGRNQKRARKSRKDG